MAEVILNRKHSDMDVLSCEITIGDANSQDFIKMDNPMTIKEVYNIEINQSYKKITSTAKVSFPKGTLIRDTVLEGVTTEGKDASRISVEVLESGLVAIKKTHFTLAQDAKIKVGQRIIIKIGYNDNLKTMFNGYVKQYSMDSMVNLECEDLTYRLKMKQAPKISTPDGAKLVKICQPKSEGGYGLLDGTGFKLHPDTIKSNISLNKIQIVDNFTVADVLASWSSNQVYVFIKDDATATDSSPRIAVGRSYLSSELKDGELANEKGVYEIDFDYHVSNNNLTNTKVDPLFLCIESKGYDQKDKLLQLRIRKNPEWDGKTASSEFLITNATPISKAMLRAGKYTNESLESTARNKEWDSYTIAPYFSVEKPYVTRESLEKEGIAYFRNFNLNGVDGDITIFGDYGLKTAVRVHLNDKINSDKNGTYLVDEVTTTFGVNGYRQKITIPFKISKDKS